MNEKFPACTIQTSNGDGTTKIAFQFSNDAAFEEAIKIKDLAPEDKGGYIRAKKSIYIPATELKIGDKTKIKLLFASEQQKKELVDFLQIAELEDQKNSSDDTFTFSDPKAATGTTEQPVDISSLSPITTKVNLPYFQSYKEIAKELEALTDADVFEITNILFKKENIKDFVFALKENKEKDLWETFMWRNFIFSISDEKCREQAIKNLLYYQKNNKTKKLPMLLLDALTNPLSPYRALNNLLIAKTQASSTIELPKSKIQPKSNPLFSSSEELAKSLEFLIKKKIFDVQCLSLTFSIQALKNAIQYDLNKMSIFDIQTDKGDESTPCHDTWHDVTPQDAWQLFIKKFGLSGEHHQPYGKRIVERLTTLKEDKSTESYFPFIDAIIKALNDTQSPYQHLFSFYCPFSSAQKMVFLSSLKHISKAPDVKSSHIQNSLAIYSTKSSGGGGIPGIILSFLSPPPAQKFLDTSEHDTTNPKPA